MSLPLTSLLDALASKSIVDCTRWCQERAISGRLRKDQSTIIGLDIELNGAPKCTLSAIQEKSL